MRARIRDTEIYFDVEGAGLIAQRGQMHERHVALLAHGGPGVDHTGLKGRYGKLAAKMQLVYFDHRGQGRSARGDPQKYTLDENVEDMEALRRYLGVGPIVSLGTSYGGQVAMAHAARYPDAVSHLILIATAAHGGVIGRAQQLVRERGTPEQVSLCDDLFAGRLTSADAMRNYFEKMAPLYTRVHDPALGAEGLRHAILSPEALNRAHGPDGFHRSLDLRPELAAIKARTLIIAGRHDWISPPELAEEIRRLIPGSDLRIFEESSHTVAGDEPQALLDVVAGFLVYNSL